MADIFISYSKADRLMAEKLAAYLESEGWSVWFDRRLTAGDQYRDEIMRELSTARAVLAIWSQASIMSEWVRAEAGRAKSEGKLIPVKAADVGYGDIPLPFGEMHTETVDAHPLIRAAVIAQLSKPSVAPVGWRATMAGTRHAVLTWAGITGGAITLFSNLRGVIAMADWARVLVQRWDVWTHELWRWVFSFIGIAVAKEWAYPLTFLIFMISITVGTYLSVRSRGAANYEKPSWSYRQMLDSMGDEFGRQIVVFVFFYYWIFAAYMLNSAWNGSPGGVVPLARTQYAGIVFLSLSTFPAWLFLVFFGRDLAHPSMNLALVATFAFILGVPPTAVLSQSSADPQLADLALAVAGYFPLLGLVPLALVSARALNFRFLFMLIGLAVLLSLNEVSQLELWRFIR